MLSKNKYGRRRRRNKNNTNKNTAIKLYKGVDPTYGKTVERLIKYRDTIQINMGDSSFRASVDGNTYINPFF